jgi:hypothetical protein
MLMVKSLLILDILDLIMKINSILIQHKQKLLIRIKTLKKVTIVKWRKNILISGD